MFIVLEIIKDNGELTTKVDIFTEFLDAKIKYQEILAEAIKSTHERHGASLLSEAGSVIEKDSFVREVEVNE